LVCSLLIFPFRFFPFYSLFSYITLRYLSRWPWKQPRNSIRYLFYLQALTVRFPIWVIWAVGAAFVTVSLYICMHTLPYPGEYPAIIANMACKTKQIFCMGWPFFTQTRLQPNTRSSVFLRTVVSDYQASNLDSEDCKIRKTTLFFLYDLWFSPFFFWRDRFVIHFILHCHTSDHLSPWGVSYQGQLVPFVLYAGGKNLGKLSCLVFNVYVLFGNMDKLWRSSVFVFSFALIPSLFHV